MVPLIVTILTVVGVTRWVSRRAGIIEPPVLMIGGVLAGLLPHSWRTRSAC
jgi:hypothetical protein